MLSINIKFQAYIPKSLGTSMLDHFKNHPNFNRNDMINYDVFKRNLESCSAANNWMKEPGNFITDYFTATDDVDFHSKHNSHTKRMNFEAQIDLLGIGKFTIFDMAKTFKHQYHKDVAWKGNNQQHCDYSQRVEASIIKTPEYLGNVPIKMKYTGVFNRNKSKRSDEKELVTDFSNSLSGTYFHNPNKMPENETTTISVSASAHYPYIKFIAPDIDFEVIIKLYLDINSKTIKITIDGTHNNFPAYELLIDDVVAYNYNPSAHGYTGPTPNNLGIQSTDFTIIRSIRLNDWDIGALEYNHKFKKSVFDW